MTVKEKKKIKKNIGKLSPKAVKIVKKFASGIPAKGIKTNELKKP